MNEPESKFGHWKTSRLGSYNARPFVTGGAWPHNTKTEILNVTSREWDEHDDYPFANIR